MVFNVSLMGFSLLIQPNKPLGQITKPLGRLAAFLWIALAALPSFVVAQSQDGIDQIRAEQTALAKRYRQLEAKLFSLHQFEKNNNPARSKLLQQAFLQSQEKMTIVQLEQVVKLLANEDYKAAEKLQSEALASLSEMLKLLQAEDRSQKIRDDIDRYKAYAKEVDRILRIQKGIRGQAEGGVDTKRLAKAESKASERADDLSKTIQSDNEAEAGTQGSSGESDTDADTDIDADEAGNPSEADSPEADTNGDNSDAPNQAGDNDAESKSDSKPQPNSDPKPSDSDSNQSKPNDAQDAQNGEGNESQSDSPSQPDGKPSPDGQSPPGESSGEPSPSQNGQQSPPQSQPQDPVQQKIDAARERMKQAQQDLKEAKRENAIDAMRSAEQELEAAKKELEEILRQLREEEVESKLKLLEERFRGMLEQQVRVNQATNKLLEVPEPARGTEFEISANRLAGDENQIAAAAGRALVLLKEDGSSIAFPITVEELQQDMLAVAKRLTAAKINGPTVEIQADIVDTLNELIAALVKTQEDLEKKQQQQQQQSPQQQQAGKPGEAPLVDQIAELKMLKSLQTRIYRRHQRYSKFLDDPNDPTGVNQDPDVAAALQRLADRQAQLTTITRQLVNEENK